MNHFNAGKSPFKQRLDGCLTNLREYGYFFAEEDTMDLGCNIYDTGLYFSNWRLSTKFDKLGLATFRLSYHFWSDDILGKL